LGAAGSHPGSELLELLLWPATLVTLSSLKRSLAHHDDVANLDVPEAGNRCTDMFLWHFSKRLYLRMRCRTPSGDSGLCSASRSPRRAGSPSDGDGTGEGISCQHRRPRGLFGHLKPTLMSRGPWGASPCHFLPAGPSSCLEW
jgi:hypothetical protein